MKRFKRHVASQGMGEERERQMTMKTGIWLRRKREKRTISFPSLLTLLAIDDSLNLFYEEKRMKRIPRVIYRSCLIHLPGFSLSSVL